MVKVGINGFGRIGRNIFRIAMRYDDVDIVAVNDVTNPKTLAHLLKYDSVHGRLDAEISHTDNSIIVNGREIKVYSEKNAANIPWGETGAELVVESSGTIKTGEGARAHVRDTVKKVVVTTPTTGEDMTIAMGVNEGEYDPAKDTIVSNASCTTQGMACLVKVIDEAFSIERGLMTTVHAFTNDQRILDVSHKDLRRARAAGQSIIPTHTGAAKAIGKIFPAMDGKLNGLALRVPNPDVSIIDLTLELNTPTTTEEMNEVLKKASEGEYKEYIAYETEELVSIDFKGNEHSCIVDSKLTNVMDGTLAKVVAWYDNEWGYSRRVIDVIRYMAGKGL